MTGEAERGVAVVGARIVVGVGSQQALDQLQVAVPACIVQGGVAVVVHLETGRIR